jgi:hypothetical protein
MRTNAERRARADLVYLPEQLGQDLDVADEKQVRDW